MEKDLNKPLLKTGKPRLDVSSLNNKTRQDKTIIILPNKAGVPEAQFLRSGWYPINHKNTKWKTKQ